MKKIIKNNYKFILGILVGALIFGTAVYATTVLSGSDVSYSNESSKLISTNVQGAIDEIYNNMVPIDSNTFQTNTAKTVYASSKGVCIERNNKLNCFKTNDFDIEKNHVQQVYFDIGCDVNSSGVHCYDSNFSCGVYSNGGVACYDNSSGSNCYVYSDGNVDCT